MLPLVEVDGRDLQTEMAITILYSMSPTVPTSSQAHTGRLETRTVAVVGTLLVFAVGELTFPWQLAKDPTMQPPESFELSVAVSTSSATSGNQPFVQNMISGETIELSPLVFARLREVRHLSDPSSGENRA